MDFLPDVVTVCEACRGQRFRPEILAIKYKGLGIAAILGMTIAEARHFFADQKTVSRHLSLLERVGLGYLELGQPLDTLSGGESQRLALAAGLLRQSPGPALYLLEEPSSGLHFLDTLHLAELFDSLADAGNTLILIEHDPLLIAKADYIVALGIGELIPPQGL